MPAQWSLLHTIPHTPTGHQLVLVQMEGMRWQSIAIRLGQGCPVISSYRN